MSTPLNVLVVEDSASDAYLLAEQLRRYGFEPRWKRVETEEEYRAQLSPDLDVIFSDYSMPCFSTRRALEILTENKIDVPLMIVSGTIGEDTAIECMKLGATDYFVKDRLTRLNSAIHRALEEKQLRREKLEAQQALLQLQSRLSHVVSSSPTVTYLLEVRGDSQVPVWVSGNIQALTGFSVEEALAPGWWADRTHADDKNRVAAELTALHSQGQSATEYRFLRHDGTTVWLLDERKLLKDANGKPMEIVGSWSDITDRKDLEEQLWQSQKLESLGQLAGGVAHDFNNLLTIIQGNASLLKARSNLDAQGVESVDQICMAVDRASALSRQLLTFSRRQVVRMQPLDLTVAVAELTKMLQRLVGETIALEFKCAASLPKICADEAMIGQVLMNLTVNARDAMPDGGRLMIEATEEIIDGAYRDLNPGATPGRYVCLKVSDTGCGIPKENLPRIFEPFFTTKDVGKGTGLGLATMYGIIRQHNGWIKVYSEIGRGTVFRVYLPTMAGEQTATPKRANPGEMRGGSETILIAEDEPAVRNLVRTILEQFGYKVLEAESGTAALEVWEANRQNISLLLTDMVMPGMTGGELAKEIHKRDPQAKVIYSSAYSPEMLTKDFSNVSEVHFLQKPYDIRKLLQLVRERLDAVQSREPQVAMPV